MSDYDAGLLNDFGAGDVSWWQDYIRAEIERANAHWRSVTDEATKENEILRAELAECKQDAELWRTYQARKQAVIDAGMARNPMRAVAANMCPYCYAMVGTPHEGWCCHFKQIDAALSAKGE